MAEDANARIRVDIDTAAALANIKNLQRQISTFHTSLAKSGAAATASSLQLQQSLLNSINRTGQFSASLRTVKTTTESFTNALEKNKLSMREYFRYSGAATKTFGRFFKTEFETVNKVARERVKDLQTQYIKMGRDANGAMKAIAVRPLALDMENLATKTQIAAQRQALLNQMLKQGSTNLLNFGKNTQWAGRQLMVGFTIPLVMLGSVASKTFMEMEKQAIRFKRVYGEMFTTTEETNKALQEVKNLASEFTKYGVAVADTMSLAADIAATGKMGADLTAQVAQATRLAILGGVEQAEALKATISLTDAFGTSAEELAGKINFLNAVENQTVTSIEDLTVAIPKAGPVVQQLGGDVRDLTFFLTAMREGGINASEGANALKSGLASLINPTEKASQMLAGFGIDLRGIVDANKGNVKGIVIDFAKALDTLDPLNRAQAIEQLFGKFQFARLSTLFQNVIKEGNQASRVLKLTNATTEELAILSERELKRIEESPMFKFQKALEDIKVTLVPLGEAFLKAVTPLLEFGTKILEKFNELDEGAKGFVVGLTAIAGVIGPIFLMGFGLIANGVANVIKMFTFFKTALNKAGTASTELGMQTDYMTQQQLEASAVAASLDQVHQRLRQTFTSETAAVNALTAAYQNAIIKQQGFMGTPMVRKGGKPGKSQSGLNLSEGIEKVPGPKGAGDVVPANLSPGEAVIPAKSVAKNPETIKNLVAGNAVEPRAVSGDPRIRTFTNATMYTPARFNEDLDRAKGAKISDLQTSIRSRGAALAAPITAEIAEKLGSQSGRAAKTSQGRVKAAIANPQTAKKLQTFANEFNKNMSAELANLSAKGIKNINQREFAKISEGVVNKAAAASGIDKKLVKGIMEQQTTVRTSTGSRRGIFASGITPYTKKQAGYGQMAQFLNNGKAFDPAGMHMAHLTNAERLSPEEARGLAKPGSPLGASMLKEIEAKEQSIATTKKATKEEVKKERAMRGATQEAKNATKAVNQKTKVEKTATKTTKAETAAKKQQASVRPIPQRGPDGRFISAKTAATQPKPRMRMSGGGIGMAASAAVMAGSMLPGDIGKMSQDLMMPTMLASMILPMMKGPVQIAAVAIGALAAGAIALKGAFDKAQDESMSLTMAMGGGTDSINSFAEFAGKVSAGQIMDKRRATALSPFSVKTGKTTFGESFVQSEAGKAMVGSTRQSISSVGAKATESQLVNQLVTAVGSGALDAGQARSIAANIAQEIGNASFGINVNAKLIELLGPNGENLLNNPLEVRVKLIRDTQKTLGAAASNMQQQVDPFFSLGRAASITGAAAGTGALIGSAFGPAGTGIGAVAGTIAGLAMTAGDVVTSFQNMGTASGAVVASGIIALQQQQEMLDSLDLQYERRIAEAKAAGDTAKAEELINQHMRDRKTLLAENATTTQQVLKAYSEASGAAQGAMGQAIDKAIEDRYADDPLQKALAVGARDQIVSASGLDNTQEYQMKIMLATGDLDPQQVIGLLNTFGKDGEQLTTILNIMTNLGAAEGNRAVQLMNMFVDKNGKADPVQQKKFIANLDAKTPEQAKRYLDLFSEASKLAGAGGIEVSAILSFYNNNPAAAAQFQAMMDKINAVDGKMTMDFVQNLIGNEQFEIFKRNQAYFESLDPVQQKTFMSVFTNTMVLEGDKAMQDAYRLWLQEPGNAGKMFEEFAIAKAVKVTETTVDTSTAATTPKPTPKSAGGARPQSVLDDIVKRLRDVRKNQIKVTEGWTESAKTLDKLFGGSKTINIFGGIEQDMRKLGAGEDLITLIAGMDPKEFEKRKNKLFKFDKAGNIIGFKKELKNIGEALSSISVGEFVNQQQKIAKESMNQVAAFQKLRAAGYSVAEAYQVIQEAAVAAAIASGTMTKKQMDQMLNDLRAANEAMKQAARLTPEGLQEVFDDGFNKAMEAFEAEEKRLTLEFDVKVKDDRALITAAENEIAKIQYIIDDYEADLKGIEDQEEKINKTYDDKLEALEKVRVANQKILDQEKGRLSVAEAITRGDLAAAAQAAQQVRETSASGYFASQTSALQAAKEKALGQVRSASGLSRVEIQEKIKKLSDDIFYIEEKTLEPANERIRLAQLELDKRISEITVLGKTKVEWETIKNTIDLARVNSQQYKDAMQEALNIVNQLVAAWNGISSKEVTLTIREVKVSADAPTGKIDTGTPTNNGTKEDTRTTQQKLDDLNKPIIKANERAGLTGNIKIALATPAELERAKPAPAKKTTGGGAGKGVMAVASGGMVPQYLKNGGKLKTLNGFKNRGTDKVPAMLTPGEYVVRRPVVNKLGTKLLDSLNSGAMFANARKFIEPGFSTGDGMSVVASAPQTQAISNSSVYNYNLSVNVASMSDPNQIAQTVMAQIRRVDSQRIRGNRF